MSIEVKFDPELNIIRCYNLTDKITDCIYFWLVDLKTNLTFDDFWVVFGPNLSFDYKVTDKYDLKASCGFEVKIYINNNFVDSKSFRFYKDDSQTIFHVTKYNEYNYPSWKHLMIDKYVDIKLCKNDVFYDLGANIGVYTMWAKLNNVRQVYSFEPNPVLVNDMRHTFANDKNVAIFDHPISNKDEEDVFYISTQSVSSGFYKTNGTEYKVQKINLENFSNKNNLLKPTIIKCDIEGSEYDFVNSISDDFLKEVRIIIFEYHFFGGHQFADLAQVLKRFLNLGYKIHSTSDTNLEKEMGCLIFEKLELQNS